MINRVVLVGRLTKDPLLKKTQSGTSVVSFTLAVNRRVQTQMQQADFINCVAWNKTADLMAQYLAKGALIGIEGRIQSRSYDDMNGKRVFVTEVITDSVQFLESRSSNSSMAREYIPEPQPEFDSNPMSYEDNSSPQDFSSDFSSGATLDIASDDLPF
ncbi:MAG: single-stranded DNA-binding protein [Erysipelotrichaceae bacterium]|nr:single-stranded DNA-binding protein [Erysipelotrichaceae bacterium]